MRRWKMLGLAGLAGVAATGVVIARAERRRRAYTPDEVRERLAARSRASLRPVFVGTDRQRDARWRRITDTRRATTEREHAART